MPKYQSRLHELLDAYTSNTISKEEFDELCRLVKEENDGELKELLKNDLEQAPFIQMDRQKLDRMLNEVLKDYRGKYLYPAAEPAPAELKSLPARRIHFLRYTAAASILILLGVGMYYIFFSKIKKGPSVAKVPVIQQQDVKAPVTNKAVITLANNKTISLDSITKGLLVQQSNVQLIKLENGSLAYKTSTGEVIQENQYNTLFNPRGSTVVDLTLSDGTRVWLNAGSSLTYPVAFIGNERKVTITGEAYFEVAKNAAKPFKVSKGNWEVEVLGTHFNVNTYDDEPATKITLLEGRIKIANGNASNFIEPGQQAQVTSAIKLLNDVDIENVMAWKNGQFVLEGTDIKQLMRQVGRWYDVDVVYKGVIDEKEFGGSIDRNVSLSRLIQALKENGVKCKLAGNVVTIGN